MQIKIDGMSIRLTFEHKGKTLSAFVNHRLIGHVFGNISKAHLEGLAELLQSEVDKVLASDAAQSVAEPPAAVTPPQIPVPEGAKTKSHKHSKADW